jgi:hypothetical protein
MMLSVITQSAMSRVTLVAASALLACSPDKHAAPAGAPPARQLVAAPDTARGPQTFRWDFSTTRTWSYAFTQRLKTRAHGGTNSTHEAQGAGTMEIVSKGNGKANLVLRDLELQVASSVGSKPATLKSPVMVLPDVQEDGSATGSGTQGSEMLLRALFPLPHGALAVGDVEQVPLSFPFNANGSPLTVRGTAKVTFAGFARLSDRTCAVLDVVFDVSQLEVPPELPGSYRASLSGTSELCFDLGEHAVVHETAEFAMSMKVDVAPSAATDMDLETVITVDRRPAPSP